jgi:TPR repeat protein
VNAGALFIVLLSPWKNRRDVGLKLVVFAFIVGQFLYGVIDEFRIWYELLPISWMLVAEIVLGKQGIGAAASATAGTEIPETTTPFRPRKKTGASQKAFPGSFRQLPHETIAKGSYWLVIGAATAVAFIVLAFALSKPPRQTDGRPSKQTYIEQQADFAHQGRVEVQYAYALTCQNLKDYNDALVWLLVAAKRGYMPAQKSLGKMYWEGIGIKADKVKAFTWLKLAWLQGDQASGDDVETLAATLSQEEKSVGETQIRNQLKIQKLELPAQRGDLTSQYELGLAYHNNGDDSDAIVWLQLAAEHGHAEAAADLGVLLTAAKHDNAAALRWLDQAASLGNAKAQYNLGCFYLSGTGVRKDIETAAQYFLKAAQQGHVKAQKVVGKMYSIGTGFKPDKIEGYKWLRLAALQGDQEAQNDLKVCATSMTQEQIDTAEKLAQAQLSNGE